MTVIRFDWAGTGDSSGDLLEIDCCSTFVDNVRSTVQWLKRRQDWDRVSVIGVRMGATLAAAALESEHVDGLVLWAPVISGRSFVRELTAVDRLGDAPAAGRNPAILEAAGFAWSSDLTASLSRQTLLQGVPRCRRVMLTGHDHTPDAQLASRLSAAGLDIDHYDLRGVAAMLDEPHKSKVPVDAIAQIVDWLAAAGTGTDPVERREELDETERTLILGAGDIVETPVKIAPDLFGIVCEPEQPTTPERPTLVLLNGGAAYRIGPGRMNVEAARRLATQGFRTIRLDLSGLGDSVTGETVPDNDSYASTAFRDVAMTIEWIQERFGVAEVVVMGLCSGAYMAFQSAAQLPHRALVESILINPLTYFWCDGMTLETAATRELIREHYYLSSAFQPAKWWKLITGQSKIGLGGAARMVARRLLPKRRTRTPRPSPTGADGFGHPVSEDLGRDLKRATRSERHLAMIFATSDPGYSILTAQAGRQARRLQSAGQLDVSFVDDADHTFSRRAARERLIETLVEHVEHRYPARSQ